MTAALAPLEPAVCVGHYTDIRLAGVTGDPAAGTRAESAARAAGCNPDHIAEAVSSGANWGEVSRGTGGSTSGGGGGSETAEGPGGSTTGGGDGGSLCHITLHNNNSGEVPVIFEFDSPSTWGMTTTTYVLTTYPPGDVDREIAAWNRDGVKKLVSRPRSYEDGVREVNALCPNPMED